MPIEIYDLRYPVRPGPKVATLASTHETMEGALVALRARRGFHVVCPQGEAPLAWRPCVVMEDGTIYLAPGAAHLPSLLRCIGDGFFGPDRGEPSRLTGEKRWDDGGDHG